MLVVVDNAGASGLFGKIAEAFSTALGGRAAGRTSMWTVTVSRVPGGGRNLEVASPGKPSPNCWTRKAIPHVRVDPKILGGVIIQAGGDYPLPVRSGGSSTG